MSWHPTRLTPAQLEARRLAAGGCCGPAASRKPRLPAPLGSAARRCVSGAGSSSGRAWRACGGGRIPAAPRA